MIAELRTHRLVELGELGVVTSALSTTPRDARAHRGRRVLRSLPHAKMRTARPDRCVEWAPCTEAKSVPPSRDCTEKYSQTKGRGRERGRVSAHAFATLTAAMGVSKASACCVRSGSIICADASRCEARTDLARTVLMTLRVSRRSVTLSSSTQTQRSC